MAKRLRFSRWRRLQGVYRFGERRGPDPGEAPERFTLWLPRRFIDLAESLARRAGARSAQEFCEEVLIQGLEAERARQQVEEIEARRGPLEGLDEFANDPESLAEWNASAQHPPRPSLALRTPAPEILDVTFLEPEHRPPDPPTPDVPEAAAQVVFRHANLAGDHPSGLLATLRRGEAVGPDAARELLQALIDLEAALRDATRLDRRLAYALHKLAFEGQVLLTDAWPGGGGAGDPATVDVLRMVQEAVDRVLSGEDIRYFPQGR